MTIKRIGDELPAIEKRMLARAEALNDAKDIVYQHTVLCQTVMPYRDPGSDVDEWERTQGRVWLRLRAEKAPDPQSGKWVKVGLPFGPKPRLVLCHLNAMAVRTQSPLIEIDDSLTAFVKRIGLNTDGRSIRSIKNQLSRLSTTHMQIAAVGDDRAQVTQGNIISGFELWAPREPGQRVLWPTTIEFSQNYFESLMRHAVPLNEVAVGALSHSAMGLDVYCWLAQRLHRVPAGPGALVTWVNLHDQFGQGYKRLRDFRRVFQRTLRQVHAIYPEARFETDGRGMLLKHSQPPIRRRWTSLDY